MCLLVRGVVLIAWTGCRCLRLRRGNWGYTSARSTYRCCSMKNVTSLLPCTYSRGSKLPWLMPRTDPMSCTIRGCPRGAGEVAVALVLAALLDACRSCKSPSACVVHVAARVVNAVPSSLGRWPSSKVARTSTCKGNCSGALLFCTGDALAESASDSFTRVSAWPVNAVINS